MLCLLFCTIFVPCVFTCHSSALLRYCKLENQVNLDINSVGLSSVHLRPLFLVLAVTGIVTIGKNVFRCSIAQEAKLLVLAAWVYGGMVLMQKTPLLMKICLTRLICF